MARLNSLEKMMIFLILYLRKSKVILKTFAVVITTHFLFQKMILFL